MNPKFFLSLSLLGSAFFMAGCTGGIEFNGTDNSNRINPRTTPIKEFILPIEAYNATDNTWELDRATILFGRLAANPPTSQPQYSQPETAALPQNPTSFVFKTGTDIWEITAAEDRNGNMIVDMNDKYGGTANRAFAGAISMVCQWMAQQVDGTPRTDTPFTYDNVQIESLPITIFNSGGIGAGALSSTNNQQQRPVDARIGMFGQLQPNQDVVTQNKNALLLPVSSPGRTNQVEMSFGGAALGGPSITMGSWLEAPQENYFIESNRQFMLNFPTAGYFATSAESAHFGGVYINVVNSPFNNVYDPSTEVSFYHLGALMGHCIGRGIGLPSIAFVRPGTSTGQEDIMTSSLLFDITFYQATGRRFQYTPEAFLIMRNTSTMPIGSAARSEAELRSQQDPFDIQGTGRRETLPGPKR